MKLAGPVGGNRGHPKAAEPVGALATEIQPNHPEQAAKRQRQPRYPQHLSKSRYLAERRIPGVPDLRIDLGQRQRVGRRHLLRQHAILAVFDARDRDHRDAARQFIETGPWPIGVKRAQGRYFLCHQRERLDEDRGPAGRLRRHRARLDQLTDVEGTGERNKGHADRCTHEVGDETARQ